MHYITQGSYSGHRYDRVEQRFQSVGEMHLMFDSCTGLRWLGSAENNFQVADKDKIALY